MLNSQEHNRLSCSLDPLGLSGHVVSCLTVHLSGVGKLI